MRILFLDDDISRHLIMMPKLVGHEVVQVYTAAEAVEALEANEAFDLVFLDHDLSNDHYASAETGNFGKMENTGYEVAVYIEGKLAANKRPKTVVVHTMNPPGGKRMMAALWKVTRAIRWVFNPNLQDISIFTQ